MTSDDVVAGTATYKGIEDVGWEEDDDQTTADDWREGLGTADGFMRKENEISRTWWHENDWGPKDEEGHKTMPVRVHSHASATFYFTDLHGLAFIGYYCWLWQHCQRHGWLHYCRSQRGALGCGRYYP
jgi:hypothetical protein